MYVLGLPMANGREVRFARSGHWKKVTMISQVSKSAPPKSMLQGIDPEYVLIIGEPFPAVGHFIKRKRVGVTDDETLRSVVRRRSIHASKVEGVPERSQMRDRGLLPCMTSYTRVGWPIIPINAPEVFALAPAET